LREEPGNFTVDFASALGLAQAQTASKPLELGADAVCDWRGTIAASV